MDRLLLCLRASDWETSLYTSDLETVCPDIFRKIDEASIPLMDEMDAEMTAHGGTGEIDNEYPFGHYRVELELPETTSGKH